MSDEREYWRGRRRTQRLPRQVILLMIILVAMLVLLHYFRAWLDELSAGSGAATNASVAAAEEPAFESAPVFEPFIAEPPPAGPAAVSIPNVAPADPTTVIMLPARIESSDPEAAAVTEAVRQSTLRHLRAMTSIYVEEISPAELAAIAPPNAGPLGADSLLYFAVTRRRAGRVVAEISEQTGGDSAFWRLRLNVLLGPAGGGSNGGRVGRNGDSHPGGDVEYLGVRYAERIAEAAERVAYDSNPALSSSPDVADARRVLLDATSSEQERLRSLAHLVNRRAMDSAAIAAAADLATRSASAATRRMLWTMLRVEAYDPALAQPLSYALLSDADATVRKLAALALAAYSGDAAASAALAHASRNDSSSEVRLAAQMAAMAFEEKTVFMTETLLDRSLTPAERLAPTFLDSTMRMGSLDRGFFGAVTPEEALAYAEIAVVAEDTEMKVSSLSKLQMTIMFVDWDVAGRSSADDSRLVDALIESSRHADHGVRRAALSSLNALTSLSGNAEARAVLESALENEPGLAAELNIAETLEALAQRPMPSVPSR